MEEVVSTVMALDQIVQVFDCFGAVCVTMLGF